MRTWLDRRKWFEVLAKFAKALEEEHGCRLNTTNSKMYNINEGVCQQAKEEGWILTELEHLEEGTMVDDTRNNMRGIQIFNVPAGEKSMWQQCLGRRQGRLRKHRENMWKIWRTNIRKNRGLCCSSRCNIE